MKYSTARIKSVERRHLINITECHSGIKIHQASLISLPQNISVTVGQKYCPEMKAKQV